MSNFNIGWHIDRILDMRFGKTVKHATTKELYAAISSVAMTYLSNEWKKDTNVKRACYFSAEFLVGRLFFSNLLNLGVLEQTRDYLQQNNIDINNLEDIEDAALGNGGLGRLAACFLDSAATHNIPLDGYGIRYKYGLFKQSINDGFQMETADNWQKFGDPWSIQREGKIYTVKFSDMTIKAVAYDTPVIGYGGKTINTLRLWEAKPVNEFDFNLFNNHQYDLAVKEKNDAEAISSVLYPNDNTDEGKKLRLKQQYFFVSASLQDIITEFKYAHGDDFSSFPKYYAIQLNDTHPVIGIPELIRLLVDTEGVAFNEAYQIAKSTFSYTNHTLMSEALEKWNKNLFKYVLPRIYEIIELINTRLWEKLSREGIDDIQKYKYLIIDDHCVHMARLAIYATRSTNGVAKLHSELLKSTALNEWYQIFPERFNNKTNGITQRRWLLLANPELSQMITDKIGDKWITNLSELKNLEPYKEDPNILNQFMDIKLTKKKQLSSYILKHDGIKVNPEFVFDIQIKRLHEYKRQFLNALSILYIYYGIKDGTITNFQPTAFIFGAKAAPGYYRAKGIIKLINEIAKFIKSDDEISKKLVVVFVSNYNVSYAEKLTPAADVSEQISTAGTEASGTGNMKFMLNGAVTLGTYDGANVEIVAQAGEEHNYIFGARVSDIKALSETYNPRGIYDGDPAIKRVIDTLIDGTLNDGGTGMFRDLYNSLLEPQGFGKPDTYYLLQDFIPYCETKLKVNQDYTNRLDFAKKCFVNMCSAGMFSSDRTIKEYAEDIWRV